MKRFNALLLVCGSLTTFALACSSSSSTIGDSNDASDDGGTGITDGSVQDAFTDRRVPDGTVADSFIPTCPSGILCGTPAVCCPENHQCVLGQCVAACASGVRCGENDSICCNEQEVCVAGACEKPTKSCTDSWDCDENQFCEPTLSMCFSQPADADKLCTVRPPFPDFSPVIEWSWEGSAIKPEFNQVINMPVVIDIDKDSVPDVIIVTSDNYDGAGVAYLRALDGKTGKEKWPATAQVYLDENRVNPRATPAAADIDGDGTPEIIAAKAKGGALAFNPDGSVKWHAKLPTGELWTENAVSTAVAIADMDGDGTGEVVIGGVLFNSKGKLLSGAGRAMTGTNSPGYGAVNIIADVNMDGTQDLVSGSIAWNMDGSVIWDNGKPNGYPAITDFEQDGVPELVVIANGHVRVQNATTGAVLATIKLPGDGLGGPPTIADFDADGVMEISSANGTHYSVLEYTSVPRPALSVKWSKPTQDMSSNVTGSSVFDFEGDGAAEVVYGDECYVRVYAGTTGKELFKQVSPSATIHEYPVLVDVDGDNRTEFIIVSNNLHHQPNPKTKCPSYNASDGARTGVFVYGDAHNKWVRTRRIWNQHAYHITNINSDGTLPKPEPYSWKKPVGFNNYRVSSQGHGVHNAPDLQVDLEISAHSCPVGVELRARVKNAGSLGVAPGVKVQFYLGADATGTLLGEAVTTKALLPGGSEVVTHRFNFESHNPPYNFYVRVDGADTEGGEGSVRECLEDNNSASAGGVQCPTVR